MGLHLSCQLEEETEGKFSVFSVQGRRRKKGPVLNGADFTGMGDEVAPWRFGGRWRRLRLFVLRAIQIMGRHGGHPSSA